MKDTENKIISGISVYKKKKSNLRMKIVTQRISHCAVLCLSNETQHRLLGTKNYRVLVIKTDKPLLDNIILLKTCNNDKYIQLKH
jgi:hypothetical protein